MLKLVLLLVLPSQPFKCSLRRYRFADERFRGYFSSNETR